MDPERVSPREREVMELLGEHLTHEEIGQRLFISVRTVESHAASLRRKLDLPDHRALVRHAVAARAAAPDPVVLPAPLTSFIGRQTELAALHAALQEARLVSAVGPGGVGKTRLALAGATARAGSYPGGVRWADLVPVTEPARLADAVAEACDATISSRRGPVEALIAALNGRPALLVLDNAEHLVNAVAVLAERLVSSCPRLTILVTSRARLALPFERVVPVPGLDPGGDAAALFVERAVAAGSPLPPQAEQERISAVCEALGGLPLAVELAAVRMPTLGLNGVERGVINQSSLLRGGARLHPKAPLHARDHRLECRPHRPRRRVGVAPSRRPGGAVRRGHGRRGRCVPAALARGRAGRARAAVRAPPADHRPGRPGPDVPDARTDPPVRAGRDEARRRAGLRAASRMVPAAGRGRAQRRSRRRPPYCRRRARRAGLGGPPGAPACRSIRTGQPIRAAAVSRRRHPRSTGADGAGGGAHRRRHAGVGRSRPRRGDRQVPGVRYGGTAPGACRGRPGGQPARPGPGTGPRGGTAEPLSRHVRRGQRAIRGRPGPAGRPARGRRSAHRRGHRGGHSQLRGRLGRTYDGQRAARSVPDAVLESGALDALIAATIFSGDVVGAHRLAQQRLALLPSARDDPAAGLELKDALHVATFCALGAGDLATARDMAHRQHELPFLRERRDLADDELMAPAALAGHWDQVLAAGGRFAEDWTAAGRPAASGRGLAPASVALAHGLAGDHESRRQWLQILAQVRGVPGPDAWRGSGYGELFEALVQLHEDDPQAALGVLTAGQPAGLFSFVFAQWSAAVKAEAAVLAGAPDASALLARAHAASDGNPMARAIARRAAAVASGDRAAVEAAGEEFAAAGSAYQHDRTHALAQRMPPSGTPE